VQRLRKRHNTAFFNPPLGIESNSTSVAISVSRSNVKQEDGRDTGSATGTFRYRLQTDGTTANGDGDASRIGLPVQLGV
jgi:hypothetical protein